MIYLYIKDQDHSFELILHLPKDPFTRKDLDKSQDLQKMKITFLLFNRGGDIRLVDLQMFRRGNPSVDLAYLFGTSTSPEMRKEHLDSILRLYYDKLDSNLTILGYPSKMYPFDAFLRDFKHTYFFGIILGSLHSMVRYNPLIYMFYG